jgi:alanyl-tRNA synthetase
MLGSWSLGDYGHPQSLRWGYELLRDGFGIPDERLYATVFGGDDRVGPDDTSRELADLPSELIEHTLAHFRQTELADLVRGVLLDEERRFGQLLERGRQVLSRTEFRARPLDEEDYAYLHDTYGLPRELVAGISAGCR